MAQQSYSKAAKLDKGQGQSEIKMDGFCPTMRAEHHGNIEFRRINEGKNNEEHSDKEIQAKKTKTFLEANPNVIIESGEDKTGNLLSIANFKYCASKYKNRMEIITADGGFDFSLDFNNQENNATRLIIAEVFFALAMQKKGGSFILKIFDKKIFFIFYLFIVSMKPYHVQILIKKYICMNNGS
jgi:hypothetical protein